MFHLTSEEYDSLRSQIVILKNQRGKHRKFLPNAFTEHGAVMLASVLNSKIAVDASIQVVRAFVKLREDLSTMGALDFRQVTIKLRPECNSPDGRELCDQTAGRKIMRSSPLRSLRHSVIKSGDCFVPRSDKCCLGIVFQRKAGQAASM